MELAESFHTPLSGCLVFSALVQVALASFAWVERCISRSMIVFRWNESCARRAFKKSS
jgi:hypothetical protein